MWTIVGQSGVMNSIVDVTTVFAPIMWGLVGIFVLLTLTLLGTALWEYWAPTQQPEPVAEDLKMAA